MSTHSAHMHLMIDRSGDLRPRARRHSDTSSPDLVFVDLGTWPMDVTISGPEAEVRDALTWALEALAALPAPGTEGAPA